MKLIWWGGWRVFHSPAHSTAAFTLVFLRFLKFDQIDIRYNISFYTACIFHFFFIHGHLAWHFIYTKHMRKTDRTFATLFTSVFSLAILSALHERVLVNDIISWMNTSTLMLLFGMMILIRQWGISTEKTIGWFRKKIKKKKKLSEHLGTG